jgi:predicted N-acetyltransferase YhbS
MNYVITTLKEHPEYFPEAIKLIESAFNYPQEQNFAVDFHLLMNESNFENCYIAINEDKELIGHLGVRKSHMKWNNELHPVAMMGGIATHPKARGKGIFKKLYNVARENMSQVALFFLWSDNAQLYNRLDFHLCGLQVEFPSKKGKSNLVKTKFAQLSPSEKKELVDLYNKNIYPQIHRDEVDWEDVSKITSADLYLQKKNNNITGYAFMNKGADLQNIVYESRNIELKDLQRLGKVWSYSTDWTDQENYNTQFAYFVSIGDTQLFTKMVRNLYQGRLLVTHISKKNVDFYHLDEAYRVSKADFLTGVFGPNFFEELRPFAKIPYISGIDSI